MKFNLVFSHNLFVLFALVGPLSYPSQPFLLGLSQQQSSPKTFESLNYLPLTQSTLQKSCMRSVSFWMKDVVQVIGPITNLIQSCIIKFYSLQLE